MALFGGSDDDVLPYVRELVDAAEGSTVTADALTDSRLNDPVLAHLDERERPHHVLAAREEPLRVNERGSTSTFEPEDGLSTVTVLTGRRVCFLVGQRSGDVVRAVDHDDVHEFEVDAGFRRSRIEVTLRDERYTAYFSRFVDAGAVAEFLERSTGRTTGAAPNPEDARNSTAQVDAAPSLAPDEIRRALRSIDEREFEQFVADLWRARGWSATVTRAAADRGIDVVATRVDPFHRKQVVQVKRYAGDNPVGSPEIQQYASLDRQEDGVDAVVVVTTGGFTRQAEQVAGALNVKLVDGDDLAGLIGKVGCHDLLAAHGVSLPAERGSDRPSDGDCSGRADEGARTEGRPSASSTSESSPTGAGDERPAVDVSDGDSVEVREVRAPDGANGPDANESSTDEESGDRSVENQSANGSTGNSRGAYGSRLGHAVVAVLTAWWTLGVGNLAYASWAYHYTSPRLDPAEEAFDVAPTANWYYGIPAGLALVILSGLFGWAGLGPVATAGVLVGWVLLPVSTYFDVQYVRAETAWNPITGWWLLGVVLLPLAVLAVPLYLLKRSLATRSLRLDGISSQRNAE